MNNFPRNYTTLILGAGSSVPYGFPDGKKLIEQIVKNAKNLTNKKVDTYHYTPSQEAVFLCQKFKEIEKRDVEVNEISRSANRIAEELTLYRPVSIDSYLGNLYGEAIGDNEIYIQICKYLICRSIIHSYEKNFNNTGTISDHWLHYLFNAILYEMHRNKYNIDDLPIKIITFNYDTLLEQKFRYWIVNNNLLKTDAEKESVIDSFCKNIIHVYGQIGFVTLVKTRDGRCEPICAPEDSHSCETIWTEHENYNLTPDNRKNELAFHARNRIRIIGDRAKDDKNDLERAKNWLNKTQTLIFSGYAFDQDNNSRLNLKNLLREVPQIYGTLYKSGIALKEEVLDLIKEVEPLHGHTYSERSVKFDGVSASENHVRHRFFAKFYDTTTQNFFEKELNLNRLLKK